MTCVKTGEEARGLIREGVISGGMIPKIEGCIEVVEAGDFLADPRPALGVA